MIDWFVIYNNEHLGPFSESVLKQLFQEGDVKEDTLIWREGMEEAIPYEDQFLFTEDQLEFKPLVAPKEKEEEKDEDVLPPDLPPAIPVHIKKESISNSTIVEKAIPVAKENKSKQVPKKTATKTSQKMPKKTSSSATVTVKTKKQKNNVLMSFAGMILFAVFVVAGVYIKNTMIGFSRPSKMSLHDFERLQEISNDTVSENRFAIAISADHSKIWLATNNPYEGNVSLVLKSIKEKTLVSAEVHAVAKGFLRGKLIEFDEWTYVRGAKLVEGYYNIEASTTRDLTIPLSLKLYQKHKTQFRFFDEILISNMRKDEFDIRLVSTRKKQVKNDFAFWDELKQKYQTVKMITTQIRDAINTMFTLDTTPWLTKVSRFEDAYKRKYGAFFTNFVIQNDRSYDDLKKKNFTNKLEIISNYTRLSRLARQIGQISMNILHDLEAYDGLDEVRKNEIKIEANRKLNTIIRTCDQKISIIQSN